MNLFQRFAQGLFGYQTQTHEDKDMKKEYDGADGSGYQRLPEPSKTPPVPPVSPPKDEVGAYQFTFTNGLGITGAVFADTLKEAEQKLVDVLGDEVARCLDFRDITEVYRGE